VVVDESPAIGSETKSISDSNTEETMADTGNKEMSTDDLKVIGKESEDESIDGTTTLAESGEMDQKGNNSENVTAEGIDPTVNEEIDVDSKDKTPLIRGQFCQKSGLQV